MSHDVRAIEENTDNHSHTKCCLIKCFIHVYFFFTFIQLLWNAVRPACMPHIRPYMFVDAGLRPASRCSQLKIGAAVVPPQCVLSSLCAGKTAPSLFLINLRSGFSCVYFPGCRFRLTTPGNPKDSICRKCRMDQTITSPQRNSGFLQIHTLTAFCPREDIDGNRNPGFAGIVRSTVNLRNFRVTNALDARYVD